jgi:hypothetical protein
LAADCWLQSDWKTVLNTYSPENIFNTDETGLYYKATLDYCLIFKIASACAGKKDKDRITVLLTCSMMGTIKMKPLVRKEQIS